MQSYNARLASFTLSHRSKSSAKLPDLRWPHPNSFLATPTSLAHAGFYFNPSVATPDAVSCFFCDKGLADWDPEDDPAQIHAQKCPKCPWAILKCIKDVSDGGSFHFSPPSRRPTSRTMEKARLATFGSEGKKWWPYDTKNIGPTSKSMAKAGFIYAPASIKDDTCTCIYCGIELGGWQPEDDPIEEHRSRQSKKNLPCPFFTDPGNTLAATKRARIKPKPTPVTPATSSDQEYQPPGSKSSARTPNKRQPGSNAKSKSAKSKKAVKATTIEKEIVAEYRIALNTDEDDPPKPRPKPRRNGSRSRSRASSARSITGDETEVNAPFSRAATTHDQKLNDPGPSSYSMNQSISRPTSSNPPESVHTQRPMPMPASDLLQGSQFNGIQHTALMSTTGLHSKSFSSPEDEELAREEQALEEQARELMLADETLTASTPMDRGETLAMEHREAMKDVLTDDPRSTPAADDKDKDKARMLPAGATMDIELAPRPDNAVNSPHLLRHESATTLTDAERAMTVEQWIRHEMNRQYEQLRNDGQQKIDAFKARATEVGTQIDNL